MRRCIYQTRVVYFSTQASDSRFLSRLFSRLCAGGVPDPLLLLLGLVRGAVHIGHYPPGLRLLDRQERDGSAPGRAPMVEQSQRRRVQRMAVRSKAGMGWGT